MSSPPLSRLGHRGTRPSSSPDDLYPFRSICRLDIAMNGGVVGGVGWLAGPRTVITRGSNVHSEEEGWARRIVVTAGGETTTSRRFYASDLWVKHGVCAANVGALRLDDPIGDRIGYFGFGVWGEDGSRRRASSSGIIWEDDAVRGPIVVGDEGMQIDRTMFHQIAAWVDRHGGA